MIRSLGILEDRYEESLTKMREAKTRGQIISSTRQARAIVKAIISYASVAYEQIGDLSEIKMMEIVETKEE